MYKVDGLYFRKVKNKKFNCLSFHKAILSDFLVEFSPMGFQNRLLAIDYNSGEIIGEVPFYVMKSLNQFIKNLPNIDLFTVPYVTYDQSISHNYDLTNDKLVFKYEPSAKKGNNKCIIY